MMEKKIFWGNMDFKLLYFNLALLFEDRFRFNNILILYFLKAHPIITISDNSLK